MNSLFLLLLMTVGVALLLRLSRHSVFAPIFRILPVPFWCYFLPMLAATIGWLPNRHPLYDLLSRQLLPVCLVLLLIGTDLKGLVRLGPLATALMLAGSLGTIVGGLMSFALYHRWLPEQSWMGIGALSASWIGGSANLLAVKEALQMPDALLAPLVVVDALIAYSWMALLVSASPLQGWWDGTWYRNRFRYQVPLSQPLAGAPSSQSSMILAIAIALVISLTAQWIAQRLPALGAVISPSTWTIGLTTTAALALSLTPLSRLEEAGASRMGTVLLYLLLASIGARATFQAITQAPIFLALGVTWILIHGLHLIIAGLLLKAPLGLMAAASQANIGGPISAPIVAATYQPKLAGVALLMAILGNILGTYLGVFTAACAHRLYSSL